MRRSDAALAGIIPVLAFLLGCSGVVSGSNPPPTPSPSPTIEPVDPVPPTPEPTDVAPPSAPPTATPSPAPTPAPTSAKTWIETLLEPLQLIGPPPDMIEPDATGDATGPDGTTPREISGDLDIREVFTGWSAVPAGFFAPGAELDCALGPVLCTDDPTQPPEGDSVVGALRVAEPIEFGLERDGQVALVFDRVGFPNAPDGSGGFGGGDLVAIGALNGAGSLFMLEWKNNQGWVVAPRRGSEARILVDGATILFVVPTLMEEEPQVRFLTFERIPPTELGAGRMDLSPGADQPFDFYPVVDVIRR